MKNKIQSKNKSGIFILCLILLIAVVLIINYTSFDRETKLGYKCDTNSHGIEVEGKCYNCGSLDNVCPNDFGINCKIKDPDCS